MQVFVDFSLPKGAVVLLTGLQRQRAAVAEPNLWLQILRHRSTGVRGGHQGVRDPRLSLGESFRWLLSTREMP